MKQFARLICHAVGNKHQRWLAAAALGLFPINTTRATDGPSDLTPVDLRCEFRQNPLGIDTPAPQLTWRLEVATPLGINDTVSPDAVPRGCRQSAYQVLVASSETLLAENTADCWDSGKVGSAQFTRVEYRGKALESRETCHWKVRVWDQDGKVSSWSKPASWTMGLLDPSAWSGAQWIGVPTKGFPTLRLRREFVVKPDLRRALAFVSGLGQYELTVNGRKAGDEFLTPGWTDESKTVLYDTRDITALLRPGANAAGILLGNGFYDIRDPGAGRFCWIKRNGGPQCAITQLWLEYADGHCETVVTDPQWQAAAGPVTFSHVFAGEDYDGRLETKGWDQPGHDTSQWVPAQSLPGPNGVLAGLSCAGWPVRAFESLRPVASKAHAANLTVHDLGRNTSLILRLKVTGPAGATVKVTPAELLDPQGKAHRGIFQGKPTFWHYTLAGIGEETYQSKFFYVGARYLQVELSPAPGGSDLPVVRSIEGVAIHADAPEAGEFSCSNDLFNRIGQLVRRAQINNMVSVLTDCPTREKMGYLEVAHLNGPALRYHFDLSPLFAKIVRDTAEAQSPNGLIPLMAPKFADFPKPYAESPEWGSAVVLVAWQQYAFTGDTAILRRHYDSMKRYLDYLGTRCGDPHILAFGLGDWRELDGKRTPDSLVGTAIYQEAVATFARIAGILGNAADAAQYRQLADDIREAFQRKFFDPAARCYLPGSQTANAFPLALHMVPVDRRPAILDLLVRDLQTKGLTCGEVGFRYLLRALADGGRSDVIHALTNRSDKPGYGFQLGYGATSLTEDWDFQPNNSQNHLMLGQIIEWFFHDLAGIQADPAIPAFQHIVIRPALAGDLTWVRCHHDSLHGRITSNWRRDQSRLTIEVTIPPNTTATLHVPAKDAECLTESGKPLGQARGVRLDHLANHRAILQVGSGKYRIESSLPE